MADPKPVLSSSLCSELLESEHQGLSLDGHKEWEVKVEMRRNWSLSQAETWGQMRTSGQKQKERTPYKWHRNGLCAEASLPDVEELPEVEELACLFVCQLSLPTSVSISL